MSTSISDLGMDVGVFDRRLPPDWQLPSGYPGVPAFSDLLSAVFSPDVLETRIRSKRAIDRSLKVNGLPVTKHNRHLVRRYGINATYGIVSMETIRRERPRFPAVTYNPLGY